jgi:hypothetical protein
VNWQRVADHLRMEAKALQQNIIADYTNSPKRDQWAATAALCEVIARALEAGQQEQANGGDAIQGVLEM